MKNVTIKQLKLPTVNSMAPAFGIDPFLATPQGDRLARRWRTCQRLSKIIGIAIIVIAAVVAVLAFFDKPKHRLFNGLVVGAIFYGIGYVIKMVYDTIQLKPARSKYINKRYDFTYGMAKMMVEHFGGYFYAFGNEYFFLYNPEMCLYVNAETGEWVGYSAASIKNVELEHVHIGSTTTSSTRTTGAAIAWTDSFGTYSGSSSTVSETTSHYEWRFDIFSNFIDYPNLTLVFPDNGEGEDFAKKAKAILMK